MRTGKWKYYPTIIHRAGEFVNLTGKTLCRAPVNTHFAVTEDSEVTCQVCKQELARKAGLKVRYVTEVDGDWQD